MKAFERHVIESDLYHVMPQRPKPMNYKGNEVKNVFHLQTPEDANSIARLANNKNAVIVGTSFVGETITHLLKNKNKIKNKKVFEIL